MGKKTKYDWVFPFILKNFGTILIAALINAIVYASPITPLEPVTLYFIFIVIVIGGALLLTQVKTKNQLKFVVAFSLVITLAIVMSYVIGTLQGQTIGSIWTAIIVSTPSMFLFVLFTLTLK